MSLEVAAYWNWIRQPKPGDAAAPKATDAHVFRRMRDDDAAFLKYVAPNIRWMDLKIASTETLDELRAFVRRVKDQSADCTLAAESSKWLEELNDGFWLKLLLEHISQKNALAENHLLTESYLNNGAGTHGDWFERLSANKPCKTIVAHIGKDTYGYFHPYENRAITIREAARIQSFPDYFQFGCAGVVDAYSIIGNAVPPMLAHHFAKGLVHLHDKHSIFDDVERFNGETVSIPSQQALVL
jgi:site-specific DNA-cytosine methylase